MDINELNDTKAMVDKDHLTHMLDMVFREDILQKDLVIIRTHTVVVVGRKGRLIFLCIIQTDIWQLKLLTSSCMQLSKPNLAHDST